MGRQASSNYLIPTPQDLQGMRKLFMSIKDGDPIDSITAVAGEVGYDLIRFHDENWGDCFILEEARLGRYPRSWGYYFFNPGSAKSLIVEVVHPLDEVNTASIGSLIFSRLGARFFLLAGCHSQTLRLETARRGVRFPSDMERARNSVFQLAHKVWYDPGSTVVTVRGYWLQPGYPRKESLPHVILTNGVVVRVRGKTRLDRKLTGSLGLLEMTAKALNSLRPFFTSGAAGSRPNAGLFSDYMDLRLSGSGNVQAVYSRRIAGPDYRFIQLNISRRLRNLIPRRKDNPSSPIIRLIEGLKVGLNDPPSVPVPRFPGQEESFSPPYRIILSVFNSRDPDRGQTVSYDFEIARDSLFNEVVFREKGVPGDKSGVTNLVAELEQVKPGNLFWRVRAYDGLVYSGFSPVSSFNILPEMSSGFFSRDNWFNVFTVSFLGIFLVSLFLLSSLWRTRNKVVKLKDELATQTAINTNHSLRIRYLEERLAELEKKEQGRNGDLDNDG